MTVYARKQSESDIYHIYVRGNNFENIFKDKNDKNKYLDFVIQVKEKFNLEIYAYAIMDNHLHLLIKVDYENLSKSMKYIQQSYTYYFNKKYNRKGRIFESRFQSKPCKDDVYLTELVKYIHLNPKTAGLSEQYTYQFTSHRDYINLDSSFVDINFVLTFLSEDIYKAREIHFNLLDLPYKYSGKDIYE
ncbi:transposase [Peptoniphilus sp. MSJ-1]|uniref:Transposase n=1 Tax=Peptoniphilus ovalis TaxID=2841503 RepID=A0ABS6FGZ9_9FIRM|nr:transposase [Peptoniphilus ovalis]MBU5668743.1 transposase [Peptoniphilus ovalis]